MKKFNEIYLLFNYCIKILFINNYMISKNINKTKNYIIFE